MEMLQKIVALSVLLLGTTFSPQSRADYWFKVNDASLIQFLNDGGTRIYLRNLDSFDSTVLGCCFNYWIDLSTDAGKAAWTTILERRRQHEEIWLYLVGTSSRTVPSLVIIGDFG
jgi:hypothetical protein